MELCGSGWGQAACFCEYDNEHAGNSLTNVELLASARSTSVCCSVILLAGTQPRVS